MGLKALIDDRVLIERTEKDKAMGKLIIPESAMTDKREGFVVAFGPGRLMTATGEYVPVACHVGEKVLWRAWAVTSLQEMVGIGRDFDVEGRDMVLVKETDLLAVIEVGEATCRVCECTDFNPCVIDDEPCEWEENPNEYNWGLCTAHEESR